MVPGESADVRLARPDVGEEELAEVAAVLETGQLTMGPKVAELEAELARACGTEHAVVVSSGTAALHLAVLALGIGPGDEVIVPAYTFPATANVVALAGARPVLVDVDPETFNLDPAKVELTPRTKAILPVHLFGRPARLEELPEATLLEDAAGALGAERRGRRCGGLGAAGCLSFHPRKIVTTGEGGAVTTNDERARRARPLGSPPRLEPLRPLRRHAARLDELPPPGHPLRDRDPAGSAARSAARRQRAHRRRLCGAPRRPPGQAPRRRRGRPPRLAGVRDPARPPRRGDGRASAPRGSSARSARTRCTASPPIATRGSSPARTTASSARSRCRCTPASPTPSSTGSRRP